MTPVEHFKHEMSRLKNYPGNIQVITPVVVKNTQWQFTQNRSHSTAQHRPLYIGSEIKCLYWMRSINDLQHTDAISGILSFLLEDSDWRGMLQAMRTCRYMRKEGLKVLFETKKWIMNKTDNSTVFAVLCMVSNALSRNKLQPLAMEIFHFGKHAVLRQRAQIPKLPRSTETDITVILGRALLLKELNIAGNYIADTECKAILSSIQYTRNLESLNLSRCIMHYPPAQQLLAQMIGQWKNLKVLPFCVCFLLLLVMTVTSCRFSA